MKNLLVAQSGGPSAAINATITGVIDAGIESGRVGHGLHTWRHLRSLHPFLLH